MIWRTVVRHEDVDAAVAIEVARDDAEAVADRGQQSRSRGHVGKRAVAVIVVQGRGRRQIVARRAAVIGHSGQGEALDFGRGAPVQIVRDEQIERTVAVIIDKRGARAPAGARHAGARRDIFEVTAAVVSQQDIAPEVGDVQVGEAVVVEVAGRHAHSIPAYASAAPLGHVFEGAVTAVEVQTVPAAR